jgi:hypothetical protein
MWQNDESAAQPESQVTPARKSWSLPTRCIFPTTSCSILASSKEGAPAGRHLPNSVGKQPRRGPTGLRLFRALHQSIRGRGSQTHLSSTVAERGNGQVALCTGWGAWLIVHTRRKTEEWPGNWDSCTRCAQSRNCPAPSECSFHQ